ncbi:MAG: YDG domain-containing protein [Ferruginibacter sp.]
MDRNLQLIKNAGVGKTLHDPTSSPQFLFMKKMIHKPGLLAITLLIANFFFVSMSSIGQTTYTWNGANNASWATGSNWSPTRSSPSTTDILQFSAGNTRTITAVPSQTVGRMVFSNNTIITLQGSSGGTTLTISNGTGTDLDVPSGSSLTIGTNAGMTLATSATASIAGTLTVNSGRTYNTNGTTVATTVTGTLVNSGTVTCTSSAKLLFNASTSVYQHAQNGGTIPTAAWAATSACNITGTTSAAEFDGGIGQTFGNFTWNSTSQTSEFILATNGGGAFQIAGLLTVTSTGTGGTAGELRLPLITEQVAVTVGSFSQTGGTVYVGADNAGSNRTLNVTGSFSLSGGTFNLLPGTSATSGTTYTLNVGGDFTISGGTLSKSSTASGTTGAVNFNGSATQTYSKTSGTISGAVNFAIGANAVVDFGTSQIDGSTGTFNVSSTGTIITAHANGITRTTTGTAGGSIVVTGTRTYTSGAKYIYDGAVAQVTGDGLNQNTPSSLTVDNTSGVTLSGATTVSGTVVLTNGRLITTTTNLLTVTATATTAISAGSTTKFIDGPVRWSLSNTAGTYVFPVGNGSGNYLPYTLVTTAASTPVVQVQAFNADASATATYNSPLTGISHTEYWQAQLVSGTFTGRVSLTRQTALGALNFIAQSAAQTGAYSSIGGTAASPSINTSNSITTLGFFVMASNANNTVASLSVSASQTGSLTYGTAGSVTYTVTITPSGAGSAAGSASLSISGTSLPAGATASFSTNPVTLPASSATPINVTLTINTLGTTAAGTTSGITVSTPPSVVSGGTSLVIGQKNLTITVTAQNKTYNGLTNATLGTASYVGLANGESFSVTGTPTANFAQANVGTGIGVTISGYTAPSANYTVTQPSSSANITTAALTITGLSAAGKTYDGTTAVSVTGTPAYGNLQNGETFSVVGSPTFAFSTATVGTNKPITQTGTFSAPSSNYTVTQPTLTASITAAPLTITGITANNKVYNGTTAATLNGTAAYSGLQNGESFSVSGTPVAVFSDKNVGTGKTVNVTGYTAPNSNYSITQPTLSANITAANLTITASAQSKTYGSTSPTAGTLNTNFTQSGVQSGDVVNGATLGYSGSPAGNLGTASVGTYTITPSNVTFSSGTAANYSVTYNTGTLTINTKSLTISGLSGVNREYDGTTVATLSGTPAYGGLANSETFSVSGTPSANFATAAIGTGKAITVTGYLPPTANYTVTQPTGLTANVTGRIVDISGTRPYDGTALASAAILSIDNNVDAGNLTLSGTGALSSKDVGTRVLSNTAPVRVGTLGTNSTVSGTSFNVTVSAPTNGNTMVAVIVTSGTTTNRISSITQTGATWVKAANVANTNGVETEIWYAPGVSGAGTTVTVNGATTLKMGAVVMEYSGVLAVSPLDRTATNSGNTNGGTTGTTAATTQANELWIGAIGMLDDAPTLGSIQNSFSSPGDIAIAGTGNDLRVYALERSVSATSTASAGGTISNNSVQWVGAIATFKATIASSLTLGGSAAGNYTLAGLNGSVVITPAELTVTADNKSKNYDGSIYSGGYTSQTTGYVNSENSSVVTGSVTYSGTAIAATAAGSYTIVPVVSGLSATNYSFTPVNGTLTINGTTNQTTADFRSKQAGNLSSTATWEYDGGGGGYIAATQKPGTGNNVDIRHNVTFDEGFTVGAGKTLKVSSNTADFNGQSVTFKSDASGTASFGQLIGNVIGDNNVTVERYIPDNGKRSWRLLSAPTHTSGQTIRQAWMEGDANPSANQNNLPGYGTIISAVASQVANGFDAVSPSTSIRSYTGSAFMSLLSVNVPIETTSGYFLYIRGDRSLGVNATASSTTATTLRSNGTLYKGTLPAIDVPANTFGLIGNVFASEIDFANIGKSNIVNTLYIWDAKMGATGGYETFPGIDDFAASTGGGSWASGEVNSKIQSGQAFFVSATGSAGSVTLAENSKTTTSSTKGLRPAAQSTVAKLKTRLFAGDKAYDANVVVFDNKYQNTIDANDAPKFDNPGENFAIVSEGKQLAAEARQPIGTEATSIVYSMKNMQQRDYSLEFTATNLGSGEAYLEDKYLGTKTPVSLSGVTKVSFSVTADPQSAAATRFQLVLRPAAAPAVDNRIAAISVYPNPVETGTMNVQFVKQAKGKYNLKLVDLSGRVVYSSVREHAGGSAAQSVQLPSAIGRGSYQLVITNPDKTKQVQQIFINK